jgi:hypothetical protein
MEQLTGKISSADATDSMYVTQRVMMDLMTAILMLLLLYISACELIMRSWKLLNKNKKIV